MVTRKHEIKSFLLMTSGAIFVSQVEEQLKQGVGIPPFSNQI